jgi:hypothetical protein
MQLTWIDRTNYRNAPLHRNANVWDITAAGTTYRIERMPAAYHLWNGLDWIGMYATPADVEQAINALTPADPEVQDEPTNSTDADIIRAFEAKADEVAQENSWTLARAESVMLRFLRDTAPAEAATIAAALQLRHRLCA